MPTWLETKATSISSKATTSTTEIPTIYITLKHAEVRDNMCNNNEGG